MIDNDLLCRSFVRPPQRPAFDSFRIAQAGGAEKSTSLRLHSHIRGYLIVSSRGLLSPNFTHHLSLEVVGGGGANELSGCPCMWSLFSAASDEMVQPEAGISADVEVATTTTMSEIMTTIPHEAIELAAVQYVVSYRCGTGFYLVARLHLEYDNGLIAWSGRFVSLLVLIFSNGIDLRSLDGRTSHVPA